jgi:Ser/Thr protein kinase RdoA (MazF antagonist)
VTTFLASLNLLPSSSPAANFRTGEWTFPTLYSTLAPAALADLVFSRYEIDMPKNCQFWHRGLSDVYLLETLTTPYILRVSHCHWRSKMEIDFELELLDYLDRSQVPVAAPICSKNGDLSLEINAPEGKRYAVLFPYAPGGIAIGDIDIEQAYHLGAIVANLHRVTADFHPLAYRHPLNLKYLLEDSLQIIAPFLHQRPSDLDCVLETIGEIEEETAKLPTESPYWSICWGDPHSGNVHITPDNQMTLFDFDQCGYGWRVFDIAKFLQVSLQSGLNRQIRHSFIQGYEQTVPLTDGELSCLQYLTQAAYIWSWSISLNNLRLTDYSRLCANYFSSRLAILKRLRTQEWELF